MTGRLARLPLAVPLTVGVLVVILAVTGILLGQRVPGSGPIGMTVTMAGAFTPLAVLVLRRVPGHPLGVLMLLCGGLATGAVLAVCWSSLLVPAWFSQWLWLPPLALVPLMLLLFPDGALPSRRWRPVAVVLATAAVVAVLSLALGALGAPRTLLSPTAGALDPEAALLVRVALAAVGVLVLGSLTVLVSLLVRWRAASSLQRRQLACLLPSAGFLAVGLYLDFVNVPGGWVPAAVSLPLGLTLAIMQYRLYDLDLYIHRGLVWLILTGLAVGAYALAVGIGERAFATQGSFAVTIGVGAFVAAVLLPAERFAQRAVGRLVYGRRDDPYAVLSRVGRHVEQVRDPLAVLPRFVSTLVQELRVPYAAIVLPPSGDDPELTVEHGRRTDAPVVFAMRAHGVQVGELRVGSRRPGDRFSRTETGLLAELAGQAAVAAEACRSTLEIQRARERLVFAREEERRRLRRDLHDGVASALVGARMLAVAARRDAGGRSGRLLEQLSADLDSCTEEVRDLVDGLRPAALDDGLGPAVRHLADRTGEAGPQVVLHLDLGLETLPAAIETVAYRIVTEALTNVAKHAGASACAVTVQRADRLLRVTVSDDGAGLPAAPTAEVGSRHGVGLSSIRSRVEEVGGTLQISTGPAGTRLEVVLPVPPHGVPTGPADREPPE